MKIQRFEDLPIWQETRLLAKWIYALTSRQSFKDYSLKDQMRRAIVSAISNIAEGFERGSNKEFIQFLYISKGSLGELRAQCYISYDNRYITEQEYKKLISICESLSKQLNKFAGYLRQSNFTSLRHKEK